MRIGLLSDVHGNLPALEAVLEACSIRCDALWCLGDTVGYGASPNECVELVRDRCELVLAGNHDLAATGRVDFATFSQRRRPGDPLDARGAAPPTPRRGWAASSRRRSAGRSAYSTRSPRDPVWEYVADAAAALDALSRTTNELVLVRPHARAARRAAGRTTA